ncbi:ABC transporter ATP-binding protein [Fumia xinanensis]|uniref:ABC transporter ATP-binding protein n=1 Tax=Fumia xinanensis TaxID=2763659 RepID=A0A926E609_9FIRM|nr:ABC transporter ATP-binding protein [Fumia xinanensis]MBC8559841.1 ABC transporter ATP-binding protein [Fumia xinanensis]
MNKIIEVKHFTKRYGGFTAVDDISFTVDEGSIFAFLGPNGAGKTTTISTLCTILDKTEGDIKINGHDVAKEKALVRKDIGIVFQDSTLDAKMTVEENLKYHCAFYKVPKNEVANRIDFALDLVELEDWKRAVVGSLSGGMKRRVEIARGLVHYPKVLFLDEPTTGLDPQTRANVWAYIRKLQKQKNITIFLTTHYMDEAEVCSKIVVMDHGKIIAHDTPENLKKQYTSIEVTAVCSESEMLQNELINRSVPYHTNENTIIFQTKQPSEVLEILSECKEKIIDFEVKKGTLNDVFLAITGKEIRE